MTEQLARLYDAWNRGNVEALVSLVHPELEFHTSGHYPDLPALYRGPEGILAFWRDFRGLWESLVIEPCRYETVGGRGLALWRFNGVGRGGIPVEREGGHIAAGRDGLIVDLRAYGSWGEALAAAGLGE